VSVWNEYATAGRGPYCPYYLDDTSVTSGKWMEAIRESAQDFEYLTMLRDRIVALEAEGRGEEKAVKQAKQLLVDGPAEVLAGDSGRNYTWDQPRDVCAGASWTRSRRCSTVRCAWLAPLTQRACPRRGAGQGTGGAAGEVEQEKHEL